MVQKKKLSPETKGIWLGIHLWSKTGLAELGKRLTIARKKLKLIFLCVCVYMLACTLALC